MKVWRGRDFVYLIVMLIVVSSALVGLEQGFTLNGFNGSYAAIVTIAAAIVLFLLVLAIFSALAVDHEIREHDGYTKAGNAIKAASKGAYKGGKGLFGKFRRR